MRCQNSQFLISDMHVQNKKHRNFVFISRLAGKYTTQNLKTYAVLVYGGHIKKPK